MTAVPTSDPTTSLATDAEGSQFNAWRDPWLYAITSDCDQVELSLRDLYIHAHQLRDVGGVLTPLDREALHRFLPAVGAVIARIPSHADADIQAGRFSAAAVDEFGDSYGYLFDLTGDKPFLQRWDKLSGDIDRYLDKLDEKSRQQEGKQVRPLVQLLSHEPGDSSSKWAIRQDTRSLSTWPEVTRILVSTWFQTKLGNGKNLFGDPMEKGSTSTWHVNPLALFLIDPINLGRTLYANMPQEWQYDDSLPMFLDHDGVPDDFADNPLSLYRCTYARNLPIIHTTGGSPDGFMLGATPYQVPILGGEAKESLSLVHERDHTRLYVRKTAKEGKTQSPRDLSPRGSFTPRMTSTERFIDWFRSENAITGTDGAFARWLNQGRILIITPSDRENLRVGIFSETSDGKGTRRWCDWRTMPLAIAGADPEKAATIARAVGFISACAQGMYHPLKEAVGSGSSAKGAPPPLDSAKTAFYSLSGDTLTALIDQATSGAAVNWAEFTSVVTRIARSVFDDVTEPLISPQSLPRVAQARAQYARIIAKKTRETFPEPKEKQ